MVNHVPVFLLPFLLGETRWRGGPNIGRLYCASRRARTATGSAMYSEKNAPPAPGAIELRDLRERSYFPDASGDGRIKVMCGAVRLPFAMRVRREERRAVLCRFVGGGRRGRQPALRQVSLIVDLEVDRVRPRQRTRHRCGPLTIHAAQSRRCVLHLW